MKTSFKLFSFIFILVISSVKSVITIKRLTPHELDNFVLFRARTFVSSYKTEENVNTPTLLNYLPVKIKLLGGPKIQINATPEDEKTQNK